MDHAEPETARRNLADLVRLNERFGGHSTSAKLLSQVAKPEEAFSLLDVGAASGDTGRYLSKIYSKARITSLDYNLTNAGAAKHPKVLADAFALPFADGSFDYVFSALFLHHFTDEQVVELLTGFSRVARKAVLINDLERHIVSYCFLPATRVLFRWGDITVHDGCISVRAAFTAAELRALAAAAGMKQISVEVHRPAFRVALVGRK